ncbi:MAG TPA: lipopolysaccharide biosynthesis protein [Planctomycetota bacterium]|nr:lipopolysaccharide biosynthesis protein [Planctomycetota bacterium]
MSSGGGIVALWRSKFLKDVATLQLSGMFNQASQLVSSIVLAFLLGAQGQGALGVAVMLQGLVYNLISVGVIQSTVGHVASATARNMPGKVAAWMAFVAKLYVLFNVILIVGGSFVLPWAGERFFDSEGLGREIGQWAWWLTLWPLIDTPRSVVFVALQGTRRMLPLAQLETSGEIGRAFLVTLGAVLTGGTATGAVIGEIVSRVLSMVVALEIYREARADGGTFLPPLREVWRHALEIPLRRGIPLALKVGFVKNVSSVFLKVLPRLIVGAVAGLSWVAYFQIAQRIMDIPMMFLQGVSRTALPALAAKRGQGDLAGFKRLFLRSSLVGGGLVALLIVALVPCVPWIVHEFYPADYAEPVANVARILAFGLVPMAFAVGLEAFYMVTDQMRASIVLTLLGCLVTIPVNVWLIRANPETGVFWGLSFYMSWVLVHFAYLVWWFRRAARTGSLA